MRYAAYLLCLGLITPAVAIGAAAMLIATGEIGFFGAIWEVTKILFFFVPGLENPAEEGWRILVWLAAVAFIFGIGAIRRLKTLPFWGLGVLGTVGIAACFVAIPPRGWEDVLMAALWLSPSIAGVAASMWFSVKHE